MKGKLALVAGEGHLPLAIFDGLRHCGEADPLVYLIGEADEGWQKRGCATKAVKNPLAFGVILAGMRLRGVKRLIMAGQVPKSLIYSREKMDQETAQLLNQTSDRNDHSLLDSIVKLIEKFGLSVVGYGDVVPHMVAAEGHIAGPLPSQEDLADCAYGWPILQTLLPLSFGQSLVVSSRSVVAVEAMEGTDRMIARAGEVSGSGVVLKALRADQDRRFDLPVVGVATLLGMAAAGLTSLFVEAGNVLILDDDFADEAMRLGISVQGVTSCHFS